jgi:hypothetical protein
VREVTATGSSWTGAGSLTVLPIFKEEETVVVFALLLMFEVAISPQNTA